MELLKRERHRLSIQYNSAKKSGSQFLSSTRFIMVPLNQTYAGSGSKLKTQKQNILESCHGVNFMLKYKKYVNKWKSYDSCTEFYTYNPNM